MTQPIALDVHTHLIPIDAQALAAFSDIGWDADGQVLTIDGHAVGVKSLFQPGKLLEWMTQNAVAHAFVSAPPPTYRQHLRGKEARRWANYLNAGLTAIAESAQGRLTPLLHLPTEDPLVATEIVEAHGASGKRHFAMPAGTGDTRTLGLAEFEPLWQALDDIGAFVFLHPGECADGRLQSFYLTNLLGNPYESTVALAHLIFGGVLERYPRIVPCFAHGGGLAPSVAGRWQRGYDTARPGIDRERQAPSQLLGRVLVDCICHSEAAAVAAEEAFGRGNIVFGSDWPFPMGLTEPHDQLRAFDPSRRRAYLQDNASKVPGKIGD
jgi:aminocarboxymuconate-semialdehyde decarboxylase